MPPKREVKSFSPVILIKLVASKPSWRDSAETPLPLTLPHKGAGEAENKEHFA